ncbi:MAG: metallophosphoesterase [Planctomycetota bacterium]|jgi:predicted MPP superfamily phosphohydrolase
MRSRQIVQTDQSLEMTRRAFLKTSGACLAGATMRPLVSHAAAEPRSKTARFGIVTDPHYTSRIYGNRYCNESLDKMGECVELMNKQEVDFFVELGDFKDEDNPSIEANTISYLQAIEGVFGRFRGPVYHVLGNHDLDSISKSQFLANVENTGIASDLSYYSFDLNGLHFVVLDANYSSNGADYDHGNFNWTDTNIPTDELLWLEQDLASIEGPVIVLTHQLLHGTGQHHVNNAADVRRVLEASAKVIAVFQGHDHAGAYLEIKGIHYYTLKAMVEGSGPDNSSYAIVEVRSDRGITVSAYRRAVRMEFPAKCSIADLNGDCIVDFKDHAIMAQKWLDSGVVEPETPRGRPGR